MKQTFVDALNKINNSLLFYIKLLNKSLLLQYFLFIYFTVIYYFLLKDHILWRDETRPILIVNSSKSFLEFFEAIRYETSPMLYHFILWIITKITPLTPDIVKVFFFIVQIAILYVILFLIKIPNVYRLLILLQTSQIGYFLHIRQYPLAVLFILLFSYFYTKYGINNIFLYLILFLLSQTCLHGCIISFMLLIFAIINRSYFDKKLFDLKCLIVFIGIAFSILQLIQPTDLIQGAVGWKQPFNFESLQFLAFLICDVFFNNFLIGCGFYIITWVILRKVSSCKSILTFNFVFCCSVIFICFYLIGILKYQTFARHHWLLTYTMISLLAILVNICKDKITQFKYCGIGLAGFLIISSVNFSSQIPQYLILISNSKNVATFLDNYCPNKIILGKLEYLVDPIFAYRKYHPGYYALTRQGFIDYTRWNHPSADYTKFKDLIFVLKFSELIKDLNTVSDSILKTEPVVVISAHKIVNNLKIPLEKIKIKNKYYLKSVGEFSGALIENYSLYIVRKGNNM